MTSEIMDFYEKEIIVFFLILYTSHLVQQLDVGVFHTYKHWHSELALEAAHAGCGPTTKNDFLGALKNIRDRTFKRRKIIHGFWDSDIWPFNP